MQPDEIKRWIEEKLSGIVSLSHDSCVEFGESIFSLLSGELESRDKEIAEKDLIIHGIEEGAYQWKQEYDNCRDILEVLVGLKEIKDTQGKTEEYLHLQPLAWENAKQFLKKYQHL